MKPYIFGHRGASGYEIENTIPAFEKAVSMGAGIEADVQLTKDNELICFHDPFIVVGSNSYVISTLTFNDICNIEFEDNREIPLAKDVFAKLKTNSNNLRYSFDILDKNAGLELLNLAQSFGNFENIEITDRRSSVLTFLRKQNKTSKLVYTMGENIKRISDKTIILTRLRKLNIGVINIRCKRNIEYFFKDIVDNGFKCYIWGVNTKDNMKRIIKMRYNDEIVSAIYTDYPDVFFDLMNKHFK